MIFNSDDVVVLCRWLWWHYDMETLSTLLALCDADSSMDEQYGALMFSLLSTGTSWRNWYLVFGHGCDTTDSQMSPQPRRSRGCGDIWESVVSQPWPKTRYQFLFYHGTTKLTLKYESLPSQTASQLSKFKEQSHCKHWVTWPDCFATPSNHCDVTTGPVSLICIDTLDKKMS